MADMALPRRWKRPPILIRDRRWRAAIYAGALVYMVLAVSSLEVNWLRVYEGLERGWRFIQGFLAPDFTSRWSDIGAGLGRNCAPRGNSAPCSTSLPWPEKNTTGSSP